MHVCAVFNGMNMSSEKCRIQFSRLVFSYERSHLLQGGRNWPFYLLFPIKLSFFQHPICRFCQLPGYSPHSFGMSTLLLSKPQIKKDNVVAYPFFMKNSYSVGCFGKRPFEIKFHIRTN